MSDSDSINDTGLPQTSTQDVTPSPYAAGKWAGLIVSSIILVVVVWQIIEARSPQSLLPPNMSHAQTASVELDNGEPYTTVQTQPPETSNAALDELNAHVAREEQSIEAWYASALTNVKQWAERRHSELDEAEKAAWIWCTQQMQNTQTVTNKQSRANSYGYANAYVSPYGTVQGNSFGTTNERSTEVTNKYVVGDPAGEYQRVLAQIRNARADVDREFDKLRQGRDKAYADLRAYVQTAKAKAFADQVRAQRNARRAAQGGPGLLDGIFVSDKGYTAMIDGVVVREGSWINGYRVRSISPDSMQVEKDGQVLTLGLK